MSTDVAGQIGMELPDSTPDRERWAKAVDHLAMAFSEAGYPTSIRRLSHVTGRENELVFHGKFPPREVALRAGELCGIRDLIEAADVRADGWPS